ncbi:gephyrin-like molybdotransferase Glp [Radiobacillus sp. PE A8.2]|uniref:molybdopterin molybdotransferase MoeA n=1 Tax=Radiobacillus sp. PE A8.2 TaxID=3380349 RepID=UPI00388F6DFF
MVESRTPILVNEAIQRVMHYAAAGKVEYVPIEAAHGRFLGEALIADHDVPLFDRSPYDGYAVKAEDTKGASAETPVELEVVAEIGAGHVYDGAVASMQAVRIMTGAEIPVGCDAVIMLEETESTNQNKTVLVKKQCGPRENITPQGEDTKEGTVLVQQGTHITPGIIALLATFGYVRVPVTVRPKVGIISTGTELLEINEALAPGKIRNSNAYMLLAQIERAGGTPVMLGQFEDDFELCYQKVKQALTEVDIVLTTGGVSVGDYDYMPAIYEKLGANVLFNKIAMRPGSVTTVAALEGQLLFGLSGNPGACFVGFELFVRPIIRANFFVSGVHLRRMKAVLTCDFEKPNPFYRFVRGQLNNQGEKLTVTNSGLDKTSAVSSLAMADALIVLPGGDQGYHCGDVVDVLLLHDQRGSIEFGGGN